MRVLPQRCCVLRLPREEGSRVRRQRVGVKLLLALAFGLVFAGCSPGWQCLNRTLPVGRWIVTCRLVNGDRSCSGVPTGADYALVMINHEHLHAREYALFVTDRRATAILAATRSSRCSRKRPMLRIPRLPTLSDYAAAGASKDGVLTVVLRRGRRRCARRSRRLSSRLHAQRRAPRRR